jgi:type II secretion system protein D
MFTELLVLMALVQGQADTGSPSTRPKPAVKTAPGLTPEESRQADEFIRQIIGQTRPAREPRSGVGSRPARKVDLTFSVKPKAATQPSAEATGRRPSRRTDGTAGALTTQRGVRLPVRVNGVRAPEPTKETPPPRAIVKTPATRESIRLIDEMPDLSHLRGRVEVIPTSPGTITLQGDAEAVAALEGLIKALEESEAPLKLEVFQLKNARADRLAPALNNLLTQAFRSPGGRRRPADEVVVVADSRSNALLVGAAEERMDEIRTIITQLDSQPTLGPVTMAFKTFPLEHVTAGEAAAVLEKMIQRLQVEGVNIIPDDRTNTLIVTAPEADLKRFEQIIKMLDVKPEFATARMLHIPLMNAQAEPLARVLNDMVNQKMGGATGKALSEQIRRLRLRTKDKKELPELDLEKPIKITGETGTNSLLISSNEDNLKAMEEIVRLLDSVPISEAVAVRIFPLKDADAGDLAKMLDQMFREGKQLSAGPGGHPRGQSVGVPESATGKAMLYNVAISSDPRTNILIVSGREEQVLLVQEIVNYLDVPGLASKWPAKLLHLEHADAQNLAKMLQDMMTQRLQALQKLGTASLERERVLVVADVRSNSLIIMAKEDNYQEIVELARKLDEAKSIVGDIRLITLDKTQANVLAPKIEQVWKQRLQALQGSGAQREMPVIETDERSNSLIVAGSKDDYEAIKALVKTLEDAPLAPIADIRIIKLENADGSVLAPTLQQLFKERMQMRQVPGARAMPTDQVAIYPDPVLNGLLVACSKENFETLSELIKKLDVELPVEGVVRFFILKAADASRVAEMITKMFQTGLYKPGASPSGAGGAARSRDKVVVEPDLRTNAIIVSASKENYSIIEKVIEQLDVKDAPFLEANVQLFKIQHADVVKLAGMLQDVLKGMQQFRQKVGPELPLTVIPDDRSNTLIISGSRDVLSQAESLVAKLDVPSEEPTREIRPYALLHTSAAKAAEILTDLFKEKGARSGGGAGVSAAQGTTPFVRADETANILIVAASQEDHKVVKSLLEHIDVKSEAARRVKVFPLEKANAQDLQQVIQELYSQQRSTAGGGGGAGKAGPGISLSFDAQSNSLIVWAAPSEMEDIGELIKNLDTANPRDETRIQIFRLKQADAEQLSKTLNDILSGKGATRSTGGRGAGADSVLISFMQKDKETGEEAIKKLVRRNVSIIPEKLTNSLIVRATPDSLAMLEQLIESIDGIPPREADVRVFHLANADAAQMVKVLESLFKVGSQARRGTTGVPGAEEQQVLTMAGAGLAGALGGEGGPAGRQLLSFTPDTRTNSVIAAGTEEYLALAEKVIRQLDEQEIEDRNNMVYRVKFAKSDDLQKALQNHFKNISTLYKELGNEEAKLRQIEREVSVVSDKTTNSLLVSVSPRYESQIMKMVADLDTPPPQVMVQVLIAEVTLDDKVEMGLEFALQDLDFSETVVADPTKNNMPRSTKYDTVGGTDLGAAGAAGSLGGFTFTITGQDFNFLLRALQTEGRLEVLSRPSIMAQDNEKAKISVGQQVPFVQGASVYVGQTQTNVGYQDVGVILEVTPHINPDGYVNLEVKPEVSAITNSSVQITEGLFAPIFTKRNAETSVTVKDGETVVIGGLITTTDQKSESKVPILGDIPGLGLLFRATVNTKNKSELLIVLTPVVVKNERDAREMSIRERDKADLLPDTVRESVLMEKLQVKPEEEPLAPQKPARQPPEVPQPEAKFGWQGYGPAKPQYGPPRPEGTGEQQEPPTQKMVGPDSYEYYLQQRR